MQHLLERIGRFTLHIFEEVGVISVLFGQTIKQMPRIRRDLTINQMAHLGVDSFPIVALTMLFAGMVMTLQIVDILMRYGAQSTLGGIMSVAMGRELGPIHALRCMATDPVAYLVVPRFVACVFMVPLLTFFGYLIGTGGGYCVAVFSAGLTDYTYMHSIEFFTEISDVLFGLIKAGVFGGIIALVACFEGMHAKSGAEGVGQATTKSVVTSIIFIFITNYILSVILY